ncbi:serpin-Z2B-like [Miscanthus floridulus]|uniref:serpin-Z2B-like n=1 Tax=Miscanthus floridulus TaxID=154761 RepID=UPI00345A066A
MGEEEVARLSKKAGEEAAARPSKKACGAAASVLTTCTLHLAKRLADDTDEGASVVDSDGQNVVFSLVSIYAELALMSAAARGTNLDEVLTVLGAASRDEITEFIRGVGSVPLPTVLNSPEEAREEINAWVSKATKDLITSILPPDSVNSDTGLVLAIANAIYFKGRWSMPFAKKDSETRRFQRLDGSHVRTPFMRGRQDQAVAEYDGFKVLKLAYHPYRLPRWEDRYGSGRNRQAKQQDGEADSRFSMCVFLPDTHDDLPSLVEKMASCPSFLWDHMPTERVEVRELRLPKFKLSLLKKREC